MGELLHLPNLPMQQVYIGWRVPGFKKFLKIMDQYDLSPDAQYRLSVLSWYFTVGERNACATARHFKLHRNTLNKWIKMYNPKNLKTLESKPRIPIHTFKEGYPVFYENRVISLKKQYPYYGKEKIRILLLDEGISVSSSWIGKIIKKHKLQYLWRTKESSCNFKKTIRKRKSRKRPPSLNVPETVGTWLQLDTVVLYWQGKRVYVITAIDLTSRFAIAYAYSTPSSRNARDFLNKIQLFFQGNVSIKMIQTDNGSEFLKYFHKACEEKGIEHTFSYPRCPKMNAYVERFNCTIQIECLKRKDVLMSLYALNQKIAEYLVEYNSIRPHQSLDYKRPIEIYSKQFCPTKSGLHTMYVTHT
ncbi:MAG: transposase family protein, partial [Candidatus Peribacteraceae bacterium]|nr:transposase family protein [Candidatus Peribacteraceae bacterium]